MMLPEDPWRQLAPGRFLSAFAPFPRSAWIHPHAPNDNFDRVCKNIWSRAREAEGEFARGQGPSETSRERDAGSPRAEEQQKETDDLGASTKYEEDKKQCRPEFTLPCPYLPGRRHPHVAKPARALNPVMEGAERKRNLGKDVEDKQRHVGNPLKERWVPQPGSRAGKQSSASEPGRLETKPICSATEDAAPHLEDEEEPPLPPRLRGDACESEDEQDTGSGSDSSSSDDDSVTLPSVRRYATDSSHDDSASDDGDCGAEGDEVLRLSDREQDSPAFSTEKDFPPLSRVMAGTCRTEAPASWKLHGQWEIPLSFHQHDVPTATLASGTTAPVQAPLQGRAEAPQANSKNNAPPAAPVQQEAYDLLADFPALQPPKKPLALGVLRDGNPKAKYARGQGRGLTHPANRGQERRASRQRRMENVPHEDSSICAGDQKSVLNLPTFGSGGQRNPPTIGCEEPKANNQPPPGVAGTDGAGVNARSWASAAKAGMKQAAAPQEKARPCTHQQTVTINRAKDADEAAVAMIACPSVAEDFANKGTPTHQAANPLVTGLCHGPQTSNPSRLVRPVHPLTHQHFGAQAHRANCPPGFRCPRFPFQQVPGLRQQGPGLHQSRGANFAHCVT